MKTFTFEFTHLPPVTKRGRQALIALFSAGHQELFLSRKSIYPPGIYRLFGGGINENEDPSAAIVRELVEETGLHYPTTDLHMVETFTYNLSEKTVGDKVVFSIHLFAAILPNGSRIIPSDDVDSSKSFNKKELAELIRTYQTLPETIIRRTFGGAFRWSDYGKIFAPVHQSVLEYWETN